MLKTQERSLGTLYGVTVALLLGALVFSPLLLIAIRPFGYLSVSIALVCGLLCTALAWLAWRKHSDVTILSIVPATRARGELMSATLLVAALCFLPATSVAYSGDLSSYRGFHFGESVTASAKQAGVDISRSRLVQTRPARLEELEWRPESEGKNGDPLRDALLRFYNGQLFQIVVTYDRSHIEGLTESDMVAAISQTYGAATMPSEKILYRSNYGDTAKVLGRWENEEHSYSLIRTGDQASFALVLSAKRLNALAQTALVEAARLDALEAPQREIESQKKKAADNRSVLDKARSLNLPNFRP